jgi:hypothetical protein
MIELRMRSKKPCENELAMWSLVNWVEGELGWFISGLGFEIEYNCIGKLAKSHVQLN